MSSSPTCDISHRFCIDTSSDIDTAMKEAFQRIKDRDPHQPELLQAVEEVLQTLKPLFERDRYYLKVLETMAEPERVFSFRVPWVDDKGQQHVNRAFRVQYSSALGPYKGGLRLHPTVNLSVIKFLGFEQTFKNALTGLSLGGGKGGSDFDPKGKSDAEILRFCQSLAVSLTEVIGPNRDVPAGDIGVAGREIGYLFGMYKRISGRFEGVFTGKGVEWGGSNLRTEATGYGVVYFAEHMLKDLDKKLEGARAILSGSGNVAQYCAQKLMEKGAKVLTMSDSKGYIYAKDGLTDEMLKELFDLKQVRRGRIKEMTEKFSELEFHEGRPWGVEADIAFPCATQNEIEKDDAEAIAKNKVWAVIEAANMPCSAEATEVLESKKVALAPAKAANAGGVAVSGLEMAQDSQRQRWTDEKVDKMLKEIMADIYSQCASAAKEYGMEGNIRAGANLAGFKRVADAVIAQGCV